MREAVCEEQAGASRQARGVILPTGQSGKQRGKVKRAGASARTIEYDQASACQPNPIVPALGVVGGTPGWAVREILPAIIRKAVIVDYVVPSLNFTNYAFLLADLRCKTC